MKKCIIIFVLFLCLFFTQQVIAQNQGSFSSGNMTQVNSSIEYILSTLNLTNEGTTKDDGMGLVVFIAASAVYIMVMQFAVGINGFNVFHMIVYFVLGGFIGGWFHSYEAGLVFSIILSLIFI